jgi:hypothetical protein
MSAATSPYDGLDDGDWTILWALSATLHAAAPVLGDPATSAEAIDVKNAFESLIRLSPLGNAPRDVLDGARDRALQVCDSLAVGEATPARTACLQDLRRHCQDIPLTPNVFERMRTELEERVSALLWSGNPSAVKLDLAKLSNPERLQRRPGFQLTGRTRRESSGPSVVEISISFSRMASETVLVLPYVLGHELFCHVYAGHTDRDLRSPFAEGLSDWVIRWFVAKWLDTMKSVPHGAAPSARQHIEDFAFDERRTRSERRLGASAAENLRTHFSTSGFDETPEDLLAQLVVGVNGAKARLATKDKLAIQLATLSISPKRELVQALDRWYQTRDPRDLLF